ncbi:MAG TPA: VWA domain-containing protein [Polyangiaceae bacterium]|nr:VWA domain-containing protein [Polyangiaceae bacterium]
MPWELARPAGLALLGLLAPLLVLYVLKVRRERRVVPSVWLFQAAERDLRAQSPFRRLLPSVPLILELLALVLLALAVAGPITRTRQLPGGRVVLIVDVSASMGVREGATTRLALARSAALQTLGRLEPGAEVMLIAAGREAELVSPFERDRARLELALGRLTVREVEGQLGRALATAAEQLRQRGGGRILLVTDAAIADAAALGNSSFPVDVTRVGSSRDNTAIVRTEVARGPDPVNGRDQVQVFAVIAHLSSRPRSIFVTLTQRNVREPLASRQLQLEPGERVPLALAFEPARGDAGSGLSLQISPPDALAADDVALVRVPPSRKLPVVVSPKKASPWFHRALQADPELELFSSELEALTSENVPEDALVVVDGACPHQIPGADLLIVNPPAGSCRTLHVGPKVERPRITSWAETDPRFQFLSFDSVDVQEARHLRVGRPADALLRTRDGVLMADVSSPGRTGTLVGFDVAASNWPLKASFVLFVRNVVELARAHRPGSPGAPARSGEPVSLRVPLDATRVVVDHGDRREELQPHSGLVVIAPPARVEFLHVSWNGARPGSTLIPTSLGSELESRIAPAPLPFGSGKLITTAAPEAMLELDWVLALLALGLIGADLAWITRRGRAPAQARGRLSLRAAPTRTSS